MAGLNLPTIVEVGQRLAERAAAYAAAADEHEKVAVRGWRGDPNAPRAGRLALLQRGVHIVLLELGAALLGLDPPPIETL